MAVWSSVCRRALKSTSILTKLGDKSNHVASIHLAQMLYIWPYIAFFSWPLLLPTLLPAVLALLPESMLQRFPPVLRPSVTHRGRIPRLAIFIPITLVCLLVIHYNTLIHPFTLADNRHYTFYVFRILRLYPRFRYGAAPLYASLGWACISALGAVPKPGSTKDDRNGAKDQAPEAASRASGARVSSVVLWLLVSTLCLATAPLVEPRYFILPWIVWRLHVAVPSRSLTLGELLTMQSPEPGKSETVSKADSPWVAILASLNVRLLVAVVETVWIISINAVIGYVFLKKGFEWVGVHEEKGNTQRFMW